MAAFICRFCGAALQLSESRVCECSSCGRLQSVPLLDSTEKAELFSRAEQLRSEYRYDKAIRLFEEMIRLSPADADLYWGSALCRYGVGFFPDGGIALNRTQAHSFLTDNDYRQALRFADEKQRSFMKQTAARIDEKRREIAELAASEKFEVYLCCRENSHNGYASEEVKRASELYRRLTAENISVFFPRVTLDDKAGSEWEPYIFGALNSARVMLVVGTAPDSFEDIWVRNAWSRFISGGLGARAVIPLLYGASPSVLPPELSRFQSIDASVLGFEQDLIRSIRSYLSDKPPEELLPENSPLVRRAYLFLEDGDTASAENICKRLESTRPADAALIRLLIEYRLKREEELDDISADIMKSENYRRAMQTGGEALRLRLKKHAASAQYNLYKDLFAGASDEDTCLSAANGFSQLGDYRDSAEMAAAAFGKAAEIKSEKNRTSLDDVPGEVLSASVKPIKRRSFLSPLRISLIAGGICAAALIVVLFCIPKAEQVTEDIGAESVYSDRRAESYERGISLFNEGNYTEAEIVFTALDGYENSGYRANECRYMQAEQLLIAGDIEKARSIFERLGDHKDSQQRVSECDYAAADALDKQNRFAEAADLFEALGGYSDSEERKNSCRYQLALELYDSGDEEAAAELFGDLGNYSDSREYLCKIEYSKAEELFSSGKYPYAYEIYRRLGGYSDSAEKADESQYRQAKIQLDTGNTAEARKLLGQLGDYKDSAELVNASWLADAVEDIGSGDKRSAYSLLTYRINDYPPAQPYIASLRNEILNGAGWQSDIYLGKYYYMDGNSKSRISWHVLKKNSDMALVVSGSAQDYLPYDENGRSDWSESTIRAWLNGEFYSSVFSDEEKSIIVSTTNGGVTDRIFLLNLDEAVQLFGRAVSPHKSNATFYTQWKLPKDISEYYSWGRDGLLARKPTKTGYERLTASPAEPQLIFPAMWVRTE